MSRSRWVVYSMLAPGMDEQVLGRYRWRWRAIVRMALYVLIEGGGFDVRVRIERESTIDAPTRSRPA